MIESEQILAEFARTTEEMFLLEEFKTLLNSGRRLRIKYGVDVTAPQLHIGHAVNLWMMRRLQDMGHKVLFLIGDFTTRIGDPTGKNRLRPVIPAEEIERNAREFIAQARMVLRFDDPELLEIRRNSEWYDRMPAGELLKLCSMMTHARLISRDMFQARMQQGEDIHMHEMLYPILQGYDSVELDSDLTIIGTDQLFNEMLGRFYHERFGQRPQVVITTKITPGIDGKAKQSKSLGNYIGLGHSPRDKFGRVMSIPDDLIMGYFEIYTTVAAEQLAVIATRVQQEPMQCKLLLAHAIVERYHGTALADQERDWFIRTFSERSIPADVPCVAVQSAEMTAFDLVKTCVGETKSNREIRRLFEQKAITLNRVVVQKPEEALHLSNGGILRIGKRNWFRILAAGEE